MIPGKRLLAFAATALLAAGLVAIVPLTAGAARKAAAKKAHPHTIQVIEHAVTDTEVPSGGGKDVTGNVLTFHNSVFDTFDKSVVGTDLGFCIRISPADGSWSCEWTTSLAKGQINVAGPFLDTKNTVLAITGGTGAYRGARGQMNLNSLMGGKEFAFIFHLN
jgi:allene oxide cyclase